MATRRLVYQNWLAELGFDPKREGEPTGNGESTVSSSNESPHPALRATFSRWEKGRSPGSFPEAERLSLIQAWVQQAMEKLTSDEREIVERVHYMGQSYREIAEKSGRKIYRLESLHRRAMKRLRKELQPLVTELYGINPLPPPKCVICRSPNRIEIDRLINEHEPRQSWRSVIRQMRDEYGLRIRTPQTLIGHKKYH